MIDRLKLFENKILWKCDFESELNPRALFLGVFVSFSSGGIKEQTLIMFILNMILRAKIAGERERERERCNVLGRFSIE